LVEKLYQPVRTELESGAGSWGFVSLFPPGGDGFDAERLKDESLKNLDIFEELVSSWALGMNLTYFGLQIKQYETERQAKDMKLHELEVENRRLKQVCEEMGKWQ